MNVDGNLYALEKHLERESQAEQEYENFVDEILDSRLIVEYLDIKEQFDKLAKKKDINISFKDFIEEHI